MQSQRAKKYQINTAALRQCLLNSSQRIAIDFDYTCAQGMEAKVSALDGPHAVHLPLPALKA